MGMMDNIKDKMSDMSDEMKERMSMLKGKEQDGTLSDSERSELENMRNERSPGM